MKSVCILLPTLNEEDAIGKVIEEIRRVLERDRRLLPEFSYCIAVLDGQSEDATVEVAVSKGVNVLTCPERGKGNQVRYGLEKALSDFYIILDSDLTYPASGIVLLLDKLFKGKQVAVAERVPLPGAMSPLHCIGNKVLTLVANLLYPIKTPDLCSGMWGFSNDFKRLLNLRASNFELEANLFTEVNRIGVEFDSSSKILYRERIYGKSKLNIRHGFSILWFLLKERIRRPVCK